MATSPVLFSDLVAWWERDSRKQVIDQRGNIGDIDCVVTVGVGLTVTARRHSAGRNEQVIHQHREIRDVNRTARIVPAFDIASMLAAKAGASHNGRGSYLCPIKGRVGIDQLPITGVMKQQSGPHVVRCRRLMR